MDIKRIGLQPSTRGPAEYFTGTVRIDPPFQGSPPARVVGASVTFRTRRAYGMAYPPAGPAPDRDRRLRAGERWGGPVEEIRPGDVIWFSPGEKHWHGAPHTTALTPIAIQEQLDGKTADWLEPVSDEQYNA